MPIDVATRLGPSGILILVGADRSTREGVRR